MSKVLKRLYLGDVVKSFGTKQLRKLTTEEPITSELIGTWVFYDTITPPSEGITLNDLSFVSNNTQFIQLTATASGRVWYYYATDGVSASNGVTQVVAYRNGWNYTNVNYQTITITGGADIENETFISWLKANATKQ